jgi:hypothetical protein
MERWLMVDKDFEDCKNNLEEIGTG